MTDLYEENDFVIGSILHYLDMNADLNNMIVIVVKIEHGNVYVRRHASLLNIVHIIGNFSVPVKKHKLNILEK